MYRIISVVGARPNFMKAVPVKLAFDRLGDVEHLLVHTGQHYDRNMSEVFFRDLGVGEPDLFLGVGSGSHAEQTARIMVEFERVCLDREPSLVIVYGDVNSTMAAAIVASKLDVPVAHVEAGLRSYDRRMPEEINRIVTDAICDLHFVTEESGRRSLLQEGKRPEQIHLVGNTMIDSLARLCASLDAEVLTARGDDYLVLTLHRPSNVDDPDSLIRLLDAIERGCGGLQIVFPVHPRTAAVMRREGLYDVYADRAGWTLSEPVGYREFVGLVRNARAVVTDSGGIQEETTWLGVPCVTLRESTERPSTTELGTNELVGVNPVGVQMAIEGAVGAEPGSRRGSIPPMWDGHAAGRIARIILQYLESRDRAESR